jgi:hypothetical protein
LIIVDNLFTNHYYKESLKEALVMDVICKDCKAILSMENAEQFAEDKTPTTFELRTIIRCDKCDNHVEVVDIEYLKFRINKLLDDNDYLRIRLDKTQNTVGALEAENDSLRREIRTLRAGNTI